MTSKRELQQEIVELEFELSAHKRSSDGWKKSFLERAEEAKALNARVYELEDYAQELEEKVAKFADENTKLEVQARDFDAVLTANERSQKDFFTHWFETLNNDLGLREKEVHELRNELAETKKDLNGVLISNQNLTTENAYLKAAIDGNVEQIEEQDALIDDLITIDPSLERFLDDDGALREDEIRAAAEWIRGHDAVHAFDKDEPAAEPALFFLNLGGPQ